MTAVVGTGLVLALLVLLLAPLFVGGDRFKPQLEAAASKALGMDVRISGRVVFALFPRPVLTAHNGNILSAEGDTVVSVRRTSAGFAWLPLLRRELRFSRVELLGPDIRVERAEDGRLNVEPLVTAADRLAALDGASLKVAEGALVYVDHRTSEVLGVRDLDATVHGLHFADPQHPTAPKGLSLRAEISCSRLGSRLFTATDLHATLKADAGRFECKPVSAQIFGGKLHGRLSVDATRAIPSADLDMALSAFRIEEFLAKLSPEKGAVGAMDFTAKLAVTGSTPAQLKEGVRGTVSLRGHDLKLVGNDLDRALGRYKSSQTFHLVDVGAMFLAGPMGLAVTRGYSFSGLFRGADGTTPISLLVSDWKIDNGIAHASDVALATAKNRIALQGGLDFVHERFEDVTVAVIDDEGRVKVQQTLRGPFAKPDVDRPNFLQSAAGPVLGIYRGARGILPGGERAVFYAGSVPPPKY